MNSIPPSTSNPFDRDPEDTEGIVDDFFFECDVEDFWMDEEDRHELF